MGTRADFYVGKGKEAEWCGSIAWDGYRDGIDKSLLKATTERQFRNRLAKFLASRNDATYPKDGWPWPWNDSSITDCAYFFFDGVVWDVVGDYRFDYPSPHKYARCLLPEISDEDEGYEAYIEPLELVEYPDMSDRKNVATPGSNRSDLIVISG